MIDFTEFKKFFLFNLIGALVISALVAVVTVLIGKFNEVTGRVLFTLLMVMTHSLVSLAFIWDDERQNTFERLSFFSNVLFLFIVFSFIISIFGIWEVIPGDIVGKLYATLFIIGFASLHGDILSKALHRENYMDIIIYVNYLFIMIVVAMFQPIIYFADFVRGLGDVYWRILAAFGIVDGTLSILTIIFYKLYMNKHPKVENTLGGKMEGNKPKKKGLSIWVWVLIIYLFVQVFLPFLMWGAFGIFR